MAMTKATRMMALDYAANRGNRSRYQSEYSGGDGRRMIGYDRTENTYRDRDNDGRYREGNRNAYAGMDYPPESRRRRDSRGRYMEGDGWENNSYNDSRYEHDERYRPESRRRRDSRGRYMMNGMDDDDDDDMRSQTWYPPAMNGGSRYGFGDVYADVYAMGAANRPMYGMGMMGSDMEKPVDERTARKWVEDMDGGEHFKPEQAEQLRTTICPECKRWEFYVAINAMYSDHCESIKKMGMDKPEAFAYLAKDFLMDADAGPHKLRKYMTVIPAA